MTRTSVRFDQYTLDLDRMCVLGPAGRIELRPKSYEVLHYLVEHAGRVVTKAEVIKAVWPDVIVTDESLTRCISEVRRALCDDGSERIIRTLPKRGYVFDVTVTAVGAPGRGAAPRGAPADQAQEPTQKIMYCRSRDGVRLAYATAGIGPPLVKTGNWLHHLEYDWESPVWRHLLRGLASSFTLIRYDARGNGMSDWAVGEISLDAWVSDLEAVVDAAGIERFPLLGISQGCAVSVAFAVQHPQRVSHLILYGGYTRGGRKRTQLEREQRDAMTKLARLGWGGVNPAFRQLFTSNFMPDATPEEAESFNELQRKTTSADCAARYFEATGNFDISDLVGHVSAPTLVMHARGDLMVPLEAGRELASGIPGARFVTFEGRNHFFLEHEPATQRFFEETRLFLSQS